MSIDHRNRLALSVAETGKALGLCRDGVYKLLDQGLINSVRVGRRRLIPVAEIERLLAPTTATTTKTHATPAATVPASTVATLQAPKRGRRLKRPHRNVQAGTTSDKG